jgi:hypothetical protein
MTDEVSGANLQVGQGAFRSAVVRPICAVCGEATMGASCPRCAAPLCAEHAPTASRRCPDCEQAYDLLVRDRRQHPISPLMLFGSYAVAIVGALAATGIFYLVDGLTLFLPVVLLASVTALAGMPLYLGVHRRGQLRGVFLSERPDDRRAMLSSDTLRAERRRALPP